MRCGFVGSSVTYRYVTFERAMTSDADGGRISALRLVEVLASGVSALSAPARSFSPTECSLGAVRPPIGSTTFQLQRRLRPPLCPYRHARLLRQLSRERRGRRQRMGSIRIPKRTSFSGNSRLGRRIWSRQLPVKYFKSRRLGVLLQGLLSQRRSGRIPEQDRPRDCKKFSTEEAHAVQSKLGCAVWPFH